MEFKFNPDLEYQKKAIESVIKLFENQNQIVGTNKINTKDKQRLINFDIESNELNIDKVKLLDKVKEIQKTNDIEQNLEELQGLNFSISMETGTGKTYVYLRTILELYKKYGLKKFIIIVPSIAIKEGVIKTYNDTKKHFEKLYDNVNYSCNEYDSSNLNYLKTFSTSNSIEIMVMTLQSFRNEANIINREHERFGTPIELIQKTNPVLILDEPQNMESDNSKEALDSLNPLFTLRYSATHRKLYNLIYKLGPIDAYNKGLVKKIEVLSIFQDDDHNNALIECINIKSSRNKLKADLKIFKKYKKGIKKKKAVVKDGDSLYKKSNGLEEYKGFKVNGIDKRYNEVSFENGLTIKIGKSHGLDRKKMMKLQIENTIEEHFRKQKKLKERGIKVLSLFFIDKVNNYVKEEGFIRKTFIKAFKEIRKKDKGRAKDYKNRNVDKIHTGYFAKKENGDYYSDRSISHIQNNKEAYDLIMKDKERLLSFEEPVEFIFSHSALREGWDNPNVFNICTLNETYSKIRKRQEIGRGLRLPVNQEGNRLKEEFYLTVIANENYKVYVDKLQSEYSNNEKSPNPSNRNKKEKVKFKGTNCNKERRKQFKKLWKKINKKTIYRIRPFNKNNSNFNKQVIEEINNIEVPNIKYNITRSSIEFEKNNSETKVKNNIAGESQEELKNNFVIKNFIKKIANNTGLTKKTVSDILLNVDNLNNLFKNRAIYIKKIIDILNENKKEYLLKQIEYEEIDKKYPIEKFETLEGYNKKKRGFVDVEKSVYEKVKYDSIAEKQFAQRLDSEEQVSVFVKLPSWFIIKTPIGKYNPDWGIVFKDKDKNGQIVEVFYLIRETKSSRKEENLRPTEKYKIKCAKKHFEKILNKENSNYKKINLIDFEREDIKKILNIK